MTDLRFYVDDVSVKWSDIKRMNKSFQNLNFMAQLSKNRNLDDESRVMLYDKILTLQSEDFIHSCGPVLLLLSFQQSQARAAPKLSLSHSKT